MWSIRQTDAGYEVLDASGVVLFTEATREAALARLTALAIEHLDGTTTRLATAPAGALAERWTSGPNGMVLQANTGDGREFSECTFTWRDPSTSLLPLMLQTTTDVSHYGAVLAGWIDTLALRSDGGVDGGGWFYDSEAGRQFRDMLAASERFGVSVDPGEVDWEDVCTEMDPEGFYCVDGYTNFLSYQIIGLTGTPFPAFADAWIELDGGATAAAGSDAPADTTSEAPAAVAAGATGELVDAARFTYPEPPAGDARYVDQGPLDELNPDAGRRWAIPLTITDDGHVYGHAAAWGTCHIGYRDECVEPPLSPSGYAQFHLGATETTAGILATGTLVINCDHANRNAIASEARDHYANTSLAWADVRATDGVHGIWVSGQLRSSVTPEMRRVLMASCLSGDWRAFGSELDAVAFQSVSVPGFPIRRQALAAAGDVVIPEPRLRQRRRDGVIVELVGAGIVRPASNRTEALTAAGTVDCTPCAARRAARSNSSSTPSSAGIERKLDAILERLGLVERRTRHLNRAEQQSIASQLAAGRSHKDA